LNSKICIIGCGWLGFPLAKKLIEQGYQVNGSTTSEAKIELLKNAHIHPFLIRLSSEGIEGNLQACLSNCKTLILNIPPGLRKDPKSNYIQKMKCLLESIETSSIEQVLFIGSTSVYDDDDTFSRITENSPTSNSERALQLLQVEALFQNNKNFKTTLLRFSGLFAEDRHPAKFLSGKTQVKNPKAPVNLIHREDCIAISSIIIEQHIWGELINASTSTLLTKKEYYTLACNTLQIPVPKFDNDTNSKGKVIDSSKLVQLLEYDFKVKL